MKITKMIICIMVLVFSLSSQVQADSDDTLVLQAGKKPTPGIHVYDADGNHLGLATDTNITFGNPITIYHSKTESFVGIDVSDGTISNILDLWFQSDDCTGQAFVHTNDMYSTYQNCETYYTGQRIAPSYLTMLSTKLYEGCKCSTTSIFPYSNYFVPAVEVSTKTLGFTIPITLPLSFKAKMEPLDD